MSVINFPATEKKIIVEVKNVYGVLKVYPVCQNAKTFAEIAGSKTLTHSTLCKIETLGYLIVSHANSDWHQAA